MINRVILVGRLTKDPELRKTQNQKSFSNFTIAVSRPKFRNADGNQPEADFINCVAWNQTADFLCQYLHKGALVGVEGRIQTRNYDDQNGKKVYVTEVVCDSLQSLESKNASSNRQSTDNAYYPDENYSSVEAPTLNISSDDLPF